MHIIKNEIRYFSNGFRTYGFNKFRSNRFSTVFCKYRCPACNLNKDKLHRGCFQNDSEGNKEESAIPRDWQKIVILNREKNQRNLSKSLAKSLRFCLVEFLVTNSSTNELHQFEPNISSSLLRSSNARNSHRRCSVRKGVLKNLTNLTGLEAWNFIKKRNLRNF